MDPKLKQGRVHQFIDSVKHTIALTESSAPTAFDFSDFVQFKWNGGSSSGGGGPFGDLHSLP